MSLLKATSTPRSPRKPASFNTFQENRHAPIYCSGHHQRERCRNRLYPRIAGELHSIHYVKHGSTPYDAGVDFTITAEATGEGLWTQSDVDASAVKYPRVAAHDAVGVAATLDGTRAMRARPALANDRVKIVIAAGGAAKVGTFHVLVGHPEDCRPRCNAAGIAAGASGELPALSSSGSRSQRPRGDVEVPESTGPDRRATQTSIPHNSSRGSKRMSGRKRGGQPGNQNAVTHGRHSAPRRAERQAAAEERRRRSDEWAATVPRTDYGAICDAIAASVSPKH